MNLALVVRLFLLVSKGRLHTQMTGMVCVLLRMGVASQIHLCSVYRSEDKPSFIFVKLLT